MIISNPTRQNILQSAYREIHRNGFQAASLNSILEHTETTKGALYHHFPSKQALGHAVIDEVIKEMVKQDWLLPLENCSDPITLLITMIGKAGAKLTKDDVFLGCPLNNLCLEMSPIEEGFRQRINQVYELWQEGFSRALRAGQVSGTVSKTIDPENCATFIVAALAGSRSLAKNAQKGEVLKACGQNLIRYLETLRP
jgi:AcrR family transcriptional regulator